MDIFVSMLAGQGVLRIVEGVCKDELPFIAMAVIAVVSSMLASVGLLVWKDRR